MQNRKNTRRWLRPRRPTTPPGGAPPTWATRSAGRRTGTTTPLAPRSSRSSIACSAPWRKRVAAARTADGLVQRHVGVRRPAQAAARGVAWMLKQIIADIPGPRDLSASSRTPGGLARSPRSTRGDAERFLAGEPGPTAARSQLGQMLSARPDSLAAVWARRSPVCRTRSPGCSSRQSARVVEAELAPRSRLASPHSTRHRSRPRASGRCIGRPRATAVEVAVKVQRPGIGRAHSRRPPLARGRARRPCQRPPPRTGPR